MKAAFSSNPSTGRLSFKKASQRSGVPLSGVAPKRFVIRSCRVPGRVAIRFCRVEHLAGPGRPQVSGAASQPPSKSVQGAVAHERFHAGYRRAFLHFRGGVQRLSRMIFRKAATVLVRLPQPVHLAA